MNKKISFCFISFLCPSIVADDYAQLVHGTMWADFLTYDKKHTDADGWYRDLIVSDAIAYPLRSYSLFLLHTQQYKPLLRYQQQLQQQFSDDREVQKAIAVALVHEKRTAEAEEIFLLLAQKFPTAHDIVIPATQALMRRGEDAQAEAMLERIVNTRIHKAFTPLCMFLLAQLYLKRGNNDGAYLLLTQSTAAQPSYAPAWLLLGTVEELRGNYPGALGAYRAFSLLSPVPVPQIKQRIEALTQLLTGLAKATTMAQTPVQRALTLVAQKKYDLVLPIIKEGLRENPQDSYLRALYIHSLIATHKYDAALAQLMHYITEDPHDHRWWGALHLLIVHPKIGDRVRATLKIARLQQPFALWGYLYEADCALREQQYHVAHRLYEEALTITSDDPIRAELYFMQALCGYEQHDYQLVTAAIEAGLACTTIHAPLYNIAAYYYAHRGLFEKADRLIALCCKLEPRNHHYHDTAAFVAYKKGNTAEAQKMNATLCAICPTDATISLHGAQLADQEHDDARTEQLLAQAENHAYSQYEQRRIQAQLRSGKK